MSKIIFTYEADGLFAEAVTLRLEKNGDIDISVCGPSVLDGNYREPGVFASMKLPAAHIESLTEALMATIPGKVSVPNE